MTPERGAAEAEALATEIVEKLEATGALLPLTSNHAIVFGILAGAETMRAINESLAPTAAEANALDRQVTTLRAQLAAAQAREQALRELEQTWRERELYLCRKADAQGHTKYAELLGAEAQRLGDCADALAAVLKEGQ